MSRRKPGRLLNLARRTGLAAGLALAMLSSPLRAQSDDAAADTPVLRGYAFAGRDVPPAPPSSIADLVLAIDALPATSTTVKRGQPKAVCPTAASERAARLRCELLGRVAELLTAANSSAIPVKLDTLQTWIAAGRYDMGGSFHSLAGDYGGKHVEAIRAQLPLGSIDFVSEAFDKLDRERLKAPSTRISFVTGGGSFTFQQGAITIDLLGLKRLVVADFLFARKDFVRLAECLSRPSTNERARIFCDNVLERTRVLEGLDTASFKPAEPGLDALFVDPEATLADLVADWRDRYGLSYTEAYFDETWNYLSAASREAAARGPGRPCAGECAVDPAAYVGGSREALLRLMMFVIAHELSHQLLGHSDQPQPPGTSEEQRCEQALTIETQADIFGVLLTRRVAPAPKGVDYWTWGPFFDGYVALYESARSRCGYFSGQARHVMFEVFYTDHNWDD